MSNNYQVLVTNDGVPENLFDAGTWQQAVDIILAYCKQVKIDPPNVDGVDWTDSINDDGAIEFGGKVVYIVSTEPFSEWLVAAQ